MRGRSAIALVAWLGALALALLIANDCDAADWQQGLMLTVLPVVSGASLGLAVALSKERARRAGVGVAIGLLATALSWLLVLVLWVGRCST